MVFDSRNIAPMFFLSSGVYLVMVESETAKYTDAVLQIKINIIQMKKKKAPSVHMKLSRYSTKILQKI